MRRKENKKLKWTKPYLASLGDILEMAIGSCQNGTANLECGLGNMAINLCNSGNEALNSCEVGTNPVT